MLSRLNPIERTIAHQPAVSSDPTAGGVWRHSRRASASVAAALVLAALAAPQVLPAQGSPYLSRDDWTVPYLEHLIRLGIISDPNPLQRPFRRADARAALNRADTTRAGGAAKGLVRRLARHFADDPAAEVWYRLEGLAGARAATHARRTAVRDSGPGNLWAHGYLRASAAAGPIAVASRVDGDFRLKDDPDYAGSITREVKLPNRFREAYGSVQFRFAEAFFGQLDRNWGPPFVEGLILSDSPFSFDHVAVRLGPPRVHVDLFAAQLDDMPDTSGVASHRYLALHTLYLRLPFHLTVQLWDGALFAGPGRQFELWFLNPFKLASRTWRDEGGLETNSLVGGDFVFGPPRWPRFYFSLFIDDFPPAAGDQEPTSGALTAGVDGGVGGVGFTAFYTAVANLTYRTLRTDERVARLGVGLGRNQSDYDQATLIATLLPLPGILLRPEVTFVRQGEGDFRQPFPPVAELPNTPVLHQGVVEKLLRLGVGGRISLPFGGGSAQLTFDAAYHRYRNFGHRSGARGSRFVGSVGGSVQWDWTGTVDGF